MCMTCKKLHKGVLLLMLLGTVVVSCVKEKYDFSKTAVHGWSPYVAAPLVNSTLTIKDILVKADKEGAIQVDANGFCTLVYRGNLFTDQAGNFINVPNQNFSSINYNFSNTVSLATFNGAANGTSFGLYTLNNTYSLSTTYQIDSIYLKTGTQLAISYNNNFPADIELTVNSVSLKDKNNGNPFTQTFTISANSASTQMFDLGNYILNLNDGMGNRNKFFIEYKAKLTKTGSANGSEKLAITPSINNIKFSTFIGYVGNITGGIAPYQDTVSISLFKNADALFGGIFSLVNPSIKAVVTNYLGCNVRLDFIRLDAYTPDANNVNTNFNTLIGTPTTQNILINKATNFTTPGITNVNINSTNTPSVVPFVNSMPKNVIYKVNAQTNPGTFSYVRNFFTDTSIIKVDFDLILPLYGRANSFTLRDTQKVNMKGIEQLNSITVRTYFDNQFPIDIDMELVYVDSLYRPLVTLVPSGTIVMRGATVNANGELVSSSIQKSDITLNRYNIEKLKDVRYLLITGKASTTNQGTVNVKIYDFYKLNVRLGIQVQPNISLSSGQ